jgi:hypothetical protein
MMGTLDPTPQLALGQHYCIVSSPLPQPQANQLLKPNSKPMLMCGVYITFKCDVQNNRKQHAQSHMWVQ